MTVDTLIVIILVTFALPTVLGHVVVWFMLKGRNYTAILIAFAYIVALLSLVIYALA